MGELTRRTCSAIATLVFVLALAGGAGAQIVPGVQQSAAQTANVSGSVLDSSGNVVSGADVRLVGQITLSTRTDARGNFAFASVPFGRYELQVSSAALGAASQSLVLSRDTNVSVRYAAAGGLKTIGRVSTSDAGAHINVTAASIASVAPSDFALQGNTQWRRLLEGIPGVTVGGGLSGGGTTIAMIPDAPLQPEILSIDGALPYETSTTLDGMPLSAISFGGSPGNGVDLGILPMAAFDTADIVRGPGANAPSIIDSIGGSFVLHAPGRVEHDAFDASVSNDPYGGIVTTVRAAVRMGRLSATAVYGSNTSPGPNGSAPVTVASFVAPATVDGQATSGGGLLAATPSTSYGSVYGYTTSLLLSGYPESSAWLEHTGGIGLSYDVSPAVTASAFYAGHAASMNQASLYYPITFAPGAGYSGSIAPGFYRNLLYGLSPNINAESSGLFEEKLTANVGPGVLRFGALQGFSDELQWIPAFPSGTYGVYGTVFLKSAPTVPVTFDGTQESLTFGPTTYYDNVQVYDRDLLASYEAQVGTTTTAGISYVKSYVGYQEYEDEPPSLTIQPSGISEGTQEYRLHVGETIADRVNVDASYYAVAGNFHEPDPTNRANWVTAPFSYSAPRLGIVWTLTPNAVVRASAGGGFAAPPIAYLNGQNSIASCSNVTAQCTATITNIDLKPETSFGYDVGTDVRLRRDTAMSFDLYESNLFGQIFSSVSYIGINAPTGLPTYATEYLNLSQSRLEGVNFSIHHDVPHGLFWNAALGLTRGFVVSVPQGFYNKVGSTCNFATAAGCANTYIVPGINFDGKFQSTIPYSNGRATIGYRWSPQTSIDLEPTYFGNNNAYFRPAFVELDAHGSIALARFVTLSTTFRNLTGIYDSPYASLYGSLLGAPTVAGLPYGLTGLPYGPRTAIVTVSVRLR